MLPASLNLPNQLTLGRLGLVILFVASLSIDWQFSKTCAFAIFIVASLTDWLDGYVARRYGLISDLGKLLDPLADKVLVSAAFVALVGFNYVPLWAVVLIISREFLITGLRLVALNRGFLLSAERLGKHKTVSQLLTILFALFWMSLPELHLDTYWFDEIADITLNVLLAIAVIITIWSAAVYFYKNRALFESGDDSSASKPSPIVPPPIVTSPLEQVPSEKTAPPSPTAPAFKEWQIVVEALGSGRQSIILRKGGIAEGRSGFTVKHQAFWLMPTGFHQQREKTKAAFHDLAWETKAEDSPIVLKYWAQVTQVGYLTTWDQVLALDELHCWTPEVLRERFDYGKETGLHCLLVRIHRLAKPLEIAWQPSYAGCKSWVELPCHWDQVAHEPVVDDATHAAVKATILAKCR